MKLHPAISTWLVPLSWLYGAVVRRRARLFDLGKVQPKRLDAPVISVGNLTVGGTGKTPMVLWLAQRLAHMNVPVGILSRGYKGQTSVSENGSDADRSSSGTRISSSDEAQLLQRRLGEKARIGIGANRWSAGRKLLAAGVEFFLLDDGFQHRTLARDVDIVLIDSTDPFGGGRLLPAGRLREPLEALLRADILVITRTDSAPEIVATLRKFSNAPIFYAKPELDAVRLLENSQVAAGRAEWLGKRVFAFCAIGNPDAFFADVQHWGMELAGSMAFRDHHKFTTADVRRIEQAAQAAGAEDLVCTEKDAINLGIVPFSRFPVYSCHVTMRVADGDAFWSAILDVMEQKRGKRPA